VSARDQATRIDGIREAQIEDICIDAEAVISRVRAKRRDALNVSNNLIETDIHIRSDAMQTDIAGNTSQPTRHPEIEVPGFALCDRGRRYFLRFEVYRTCCHAADDCDQRPCEERQFNSHGSIL